MERVIKCAIKVLSLRISFEGFTFSLLDVIIYSMIASIVTYVVFKILN